MHYGRSYVVRTYTELFLQWFKPYRPFGSHWLFWELSVLIVTVIYSKFYRPFASHRLTIFHATCDEIYSSCQITNGNWNGQYYLHVVVSIIKPIAILLYAILLFTCFSSAGSVSSGNFWLEILVNKETLLIVVYINIPNIYYTTSFAFEISKLHCNANDIIGRVIINSEYTVAIYLWFICGLQVETIITWPLRLSYTTQLYDSVIRLSYTTQLYDSVIRLSYTTQLYDSVIRLSYTTQLYDHIQYSTFEAGLTLITQFPKQRF
jgi:hypothetical protein